MNSRDNEWCRLPGGLGEGRREEQGSPWGTWGTQVGQRGKEHGVGVLCSEQSFGLKAFILTSPGYLFEANICGKEKSTQVLRTCYLSIRHCREKPRPISLHLQVLYTVWAMRYRFGRDEIALVHFSAVAGRRRLLPVE